MYYLRIIMEAAEYRGVDDPAEESRPYSRLLLWFLLSFFVVWALRATLFFTIDGKIESGSLRLAYSNAIKFAVWVIPAIIYLKRVVKTDALRYLKLSSKPAGRGLILGSLATILFFAGIILFERFTSGKNLRLLLEAAPIEWSTVVLTVLPSSFSEELLFRGFILNQLDDRMGFWKANALSSLLFVLVHWPNWLWVNGFKSWILFTSVSIFILSLFLGYLMKLTNSLWPSVLGHTINNFLATYMRV